MVTSGDLRNKRMCPCQVCNRQRYAADMVDRGVHQIAGHARWCKERPRPDRVFDRRTGRMIPDTDPNFEAVVKLIEDDEQERLK